MRVLCLIIAAIINIVVTFMVPAPWGMLCWFVGAVLGWEIAIAQSDAKRDYY